MSSISIVANKITLKGIVSRVFLATMFFISIIHSKLPSILDYAKGVVKADTGLMEGNIKGWIFKVTL